MGDERRYPAAKLGCCGNKQDVILTVDEEKTLRTNGRIKKGIVCNKCGSSRSLEVNRKGDKTIIKDIT